MRQTEARPGSGTPGHPASTSGTEEFAQSANLVEKRT